MVAQIVFRVCDDGCAKVVRGKRLESKVVGINTKETNNLVLSIFMTLPTGTSDEKNLLASLSKQNNFDPWNGSKRLGDDKFDREISSM